MADIVPSYLTGAATDTAILQAMLQSLPATLDTSQGSFTWDALAPAAAQFAQAAIWGQLILQYGFVTTTYGPYLDLRAKEQGLTRLAPTAATGTVTFTGTSGTVIPQGTVVATASTISAPSHGFATTAAVTIGTGGTVGATVTATATGASGNVGANTVTIVVKGIAGVTGVTNSAAMSGGTDQETDAALLTRYLAKVQHPSAGGNIGDYTNWALGVNGVGGVSVVPIWNGAGTVKIVLIDTNKAPATQTLIDTVQKAIAPPWSFSKEAEVLPLSGPGLSVDTTQTDASGGSCVKMVYGSLSAPTTAPTATLSAVAGNVDVGSHVYAVTYVGTNGGETLIGPASGAVTTATGSQQVALSAIPTGPTGVSSRKMYRSKANTTTPLFYLGVLGDNTTTSFTDNSPDASLGANPPSTGTAASDGLVTDAADQTLVADFNGLQPSRMPQPGIWQARPLVKVSATNGTLPLLRVSVWNTTTGTWCPTAPSSTTPATTTFSGSQLNGSFTKVVQPFYWNGSDQLQLRVRRIGPTVVAPGAPTLTASGAGSGLAAGTYTVGYTWTVGSGETTIGSTATVTITAGQQIGVAIPSFPATVDSAKIYLSTAAGGATLGYATTVTTPSTVTVGAVGNATAPPTTNTTGGDTATTLWFDLAEYRSAFSQDTGTGLAPVGAQVAVVAATPVPIAVSATLTIANGYDVNAVRAATGTALTTLLQSKAFAANPTVHYAVIGATILGVAGVTNYTNLLVNGGTADVAITNTQIATLGTTTWS